MIPVERLHEVSLGLRAHLASLEPASVIVKEDSVLHRTIAQGFGAAHDVSELLAHLSIDVPVRLPSERGYLEEFTTTIADVIAEPRAWHAPDHALVRLLTEPHEWQHVRQHRKGVDAGWWPTATSHSVLYLCSVATDDAAEYVGHVEGDGYAVTEAVRYYLSGRLRPLEDVVEGLRRHYALRSAGAEVAIATLRSHYRTLADGGVPNVWAARESVGWLTQHAPDLVGQVTL